MIICQKVNRNNAVNIWFLMFKIFQLNFNKT